MKRVHSDDSALDPYRNAKSSFSFPAAGKEPGPEPAGQIARQVIADGEKTVLRLLESNWTCESIYCLEKYYQKNHLLFLSKVADDRIFVASKAEMEKVIGYAVHQGCMASFQLPPLVLLEGIQPPLVFLHQVRDAENVGSIVRNCLALGVKSLVYDAGSCSPYVRRAIRVAMGHTAKMAIAHSANAIPDLQKLADRGIEIIGTTRQASASLFGFRFQKPFALVLGNEGTGLTEEVKQCCQHLLSIPMFHGIDSLNVAAAALACLVAWRASNPEEHFR